MRLPLYSGLVILCRLTPRVFLSFFSRVFFLSPGSQPRDCVLRPADPGGLQRPAIKLCRKVQHTQAVENDRNKGRSTPQSGPDSAWPRIVASSSCVFAPEHCRNGATRRNFAPRAAIVRRPREGKRGQARHASLRPRIQGRHTVAWRGRGMFYCRFGCGDMPPTSRRLTGYEWSAA